MGVRFVDVPFNSDGGAVGVALAPAALGLGEVTVPIHGATPVRGEYGFRAEEALVRMVADVAAIVRETWYTGHVPVLLGGDCPIMLGALQNLDGGLVFIDGHEDAWPPLEEQSGEAADSELGIALGLFDAPVQPSVRADRVVVLGPRDADEIVGKHVHRVDDLVTFRDGGWLGTASDEDLDEVLIPVGDRWWLHVDLDVLSTEALAAVDYQQPGGIDWERLEHVTRRILARPGCRGASVVIYNPELDGGAATPRVAAYARTVGELLASPAPADRAAAD